MQILSNPISPLHVGESTICRDCHLFPLYLIIFMFHTKLDAAGIVLRVHYKSMKCDVLFSQGSVRTLFRRGGHFSYVSKNIFSSLQQCKNY